MKIFIANRSGNVGKTTIRRHLFEPRMPGAEVVSVETINNDGADEGAIRGEQFALVQDLLLTVDQVIVDIGSSNFEAFRDLMRKYEGSHDDVDRFIIPTEPEIKQEKDTILTINDLADMGVPAEKIVVLFNKIRREEQIEEGFQLLHAFHSNERRFTLRRDAFVLENPIFETLSKLPGRTLAEIRDDPTDYKVLLAEAMKGGASETEKTRIKAMIATKRLAVGVISQFDDAYKAITRKGKSGE